MDSSSSSPTSEYDFETPPPEGGHRAAPTLRPRTVDHAIARAKAGGDLEEEVFGISYEAGRAFIRAGYPGVEAASGPISGPEEIGAEFGWATHAVAESAVAEAGFDTTDPEVITGIRDGIEQAEADAGTAALVGFQGGNGEECEIARAFSAAPDPPSRPRAVGTLPPAAPLHHSGRHRRASRAAATRHRGSRRTGAGSQSGPDDDPHDESDIAATAAFSGAGPMSCARRRSDQSAWSVPLGSLVCARCFFGSFTAAEESELERGDRQREIAQAIRGSLDRVDEGRHQALHDRALLIEVASSADEVRELVREVEQLGIHLGVRS
jgi:hypothetical protein